MKITLTKHCIKRFLKSTKCLWKTHTNHKYVRQDVWHKSMEKIHTICIIIKALRKPYYFRQLIFKTQIIIRCWVGH